MNVKVLGLVLICQTLTAIVFIVGFINYYKWLGIPLIILSVCLLWIGEKKQWLWMSSLVFVFQISLATIGALVGVSAYLMIAGSIVALACWDLNDLLKNQKVSTDNPLFEKYKRNRIKFLGLSIGFGFVFAEIGLLIRTKLPFALVFLIGIIVLFCLYKLFSMIKK